MAATSTPDPISSGGLWEIALGLMVVCAAIVLLGWVMRRLQPGALGMTSHMRIVGSLSVGARERLLIVECGGKQHMIGVTQTQINLITELDQLVGEDQPAAGNEFGDKLRQVLGKANAQ